MLRSTLIAGWACLALFSSTGAAATATPGNVASLLQDADSIKTADHKKFVTLLGNLDSLSIQLSPSQRLYLDYLKAWQDAYVGDYVAAIPRLDVVINRSNDVTLRFRASVTIVNVLAIAKRYEEAYSRLSQLIDLLPQIHDPDARQQGLIVAGLLYNQVGQFDLTMSYADRVIAENWAGKGLCKGQELKLEAWYKARRTEEFNNGVQNGIDACEKAAEPIWTDLIRSFASRLAIDQGHSDEAIKLLQNDYATIQSTHYPPLMSVADATLAQAYWKTGDPVQARLYAQRATNGAVRNEYTESLVNAYEVLYAVEKQRGDAAAALNWHEKFAVADKGYLSDTSSRALAFQMVRQQVQQKKQQVDALNKENLVLHLKQQVDKKNAEAGKLLVLLLATVLASIGLYAWRTKRSQLKFMNLARRDGLTGIFNRQHFIEASEGILAYAAKSVRDASVIVIDLDHFKDVNDTYGHAAGDRVLKAAVAACQAQLRSLDVFGRLGGEEFGILLPDCVPERAADVAEQMRSAVAALATIEGNGIDFPVSASFGVSAARWLGYDLRQLLAHADSALYRAKREGRNRVAIHDDNGDLAEKLASGILDRRRG